MPHATFPDRSIGLVAHNAGLSEAPCLSPRIKGTDNVPLKATHALVFSTACESEWPSLFPDSFLDGVGVERVVRFDGGFLLMS